MKIIVLVFFLIFSFSCSKDEKTNNNTYNGIENNGDLNQNIDINQEDIDKITKEFEDTLNELFKIEEQNTTIDNQEIKQNTNEIQDNLNELN